MWVTVSECQGHTADRHPKQYAGKLTFVPMLDREFAFGLKFIVQAKTERFSVDQQADGLKPTGDHASFVLEFKFETLAKPELAGRERFARVESDGVLGDQVPG